MTNTLDTSTTTNNFKDPEMEKVLEALLENNEDITARAVARLHPSIKAASTIIRSEHRSKLLEKYQERQKEFRGWQGRLSKYSKGQSASALAEKDIRIAELERQVNLLTASHVAMIRAVGEMGGFARWSQFFDKFKTVRDGLTNPDNTPQSKL